jgi:hypothetical protein
MSGLPMALVWLGVTIVLAGSLSDRQAWAWWVTTFAGGLVGIFNALQIIGHLLLSIAEVERDGPLRFTPLLIGIAALGMLIAVVLLTLPAAKAAFGMQTQKPSDRQRPYDR